MLNLTQSVDIMWCTSCGTLKMGKLEQTPMDHSCEEHEWKAVIKTGRKKKITQGKRTLPFSTSADYGTMSCVICDGIMVRSGSCYCCTSCGETSGCS